jgi:hypothetical protein
VVERKGIKGPKSGDKPVDPFSSEAVTRMYTDCRRYGRPYPLAVFDLNEDPDITPEDSGPNSDSRGRENRREE